MISKLTAILSRDDGTDNENIKLDIQEMIENGELIDVYNGLSEILDKC